MLSTTVRPAPVRGSTALHVRRQTRSRAVAPARAAGINADFDDFVQEMQHRICSDAEAADGSGKAFITDKWDRGEGGKYVHATVALPG